LRYLLLTHFLHAATLQDVTEKEDVTDLSNMSPLKAFKMNRRGRNKKA